MLNAATTAVGLAGIGASTAVIARQAGVAEGTLFRYFTNKDALLNALFLHLKQSLGEAMMVGFDPSLDQKSCTRHIWNRFVDWGLANPDAHLAMRQLAVSDKITPETFDKVEALYPELHKLAQHCLRREFLDHDSRLFADALFFRLAETTMEFAGRKPEQADTWICAGFEAMWRALSLEEQ
nr:TetR/AcrR family transcriptional regulator [Shimwellia pseudoproteus]